MKDQRQQQSQDEWAIPQPTQPTVQFDVRRAAIPGARPRLFHEHQGQKYAFPVAIITVPDEDLKRCSTQDVTRAATCHDRITVILSVDDGNVELVMGILEEWARRTEDNACMTTVANTAEYLHRAVSLADSEAGAMMVNIGETLKLTARQPARSACEALFQAVDRLRNQNTHALHLFPA